MVVLHIAPISLDKYTGLKPSVLSYVSHQNKVEGVKTALLVSKPQAPTEIDNIDFPFFITGLNGISTNIECLPEPFNKPDLVIFHSTYIPAHIKVARHLAKHNVPYIIMPHGGLTSHSQSKARLKKLLANVVVFRKYVADCLALHFLTEREAIQSSRWKKQFFIVPNGISTSEEWHTRTTIEGSLKFLFIGRIDIYHKGLDLFVKACARIRDVLRMAHVIVDIYGPDYDEDGKQLYQLVVDHGLADMISLKGPVYGEMKRDVFLSYDLFFHTSRSEGHPMAVLEALSYGLPCLVTPGTNMANEIMDAGCGWVAEDNDEEGLSNVILQIIQDRSNIPVRGRKSLLLAKRYEWANVAQESIDKYMALTSKAEQ